MTQGQFALRVTATLMMAIEDLTIPMSAHAAAAACLLTCSALPAAGCWYLCDLFGLTP